MNPSSLKSPDLSFVATCRNDDHGGQFLRRLRIFANGLAASCREHNLAAELVLVDWNTPADRPPLYEVVDWDAGGPLVFRFIQVPPEIHQTFQNSDKISLFQMIAKNVGIRRASAPFVLATNVDILFSDELIEFLAGNRLDPTEMYRLDRLDVPANIPDGTVGEQLKWCAENIIRAHGAEGTVVFPSPRKPWPARVRTGLGRAVRGGSGHREGARVAHTNGCGDFTLMSKKAWEQARGYLELPTFCLHLDGILCMMAIGLGLRQVVLKDPMRMYHIDHGLGWASLSFEERLRVFKKTPWFDSGLLSEINDTVAAGRVPAVFNNEDWGLINEKLSERAVS